MNSSRTCTCLEVYGENPDCPLHGVGTDWAMANPDICELLERAEAAESALRQANARIAEMEGALRPFAASSESAGPQHEFVTVKLADCDRARAALRSQSEETR